MKKKLITCALLGAAALSLVACGPEKTPTVEQTPTVEKTPTPTEPAFDAAALVANFDESINTTVKLTYNANYGVDVVREGADASGMASFKHEIRAKSVIEMDLGTDLYIKITKEWQDLLISEDITKTEELLYKQDGKYYYVNSSTTKAVEVASADAQAKLEAILADTTYELAGGLSLDALLYNSLDKSYELKVFGLSDTFIEEDLVDPVYSAGTNGGLHVEYKPEYVGYRTDGGWSDFSNSSDGYAAVIDIDTNEKGYVTSWKEKYNSASLVFNIMTPPPTVTITGQKDFTATYGEAITKVTSVGYAAQMVDVTLNETQNGTYQVKWFDYDGGSFAMNDLVDGQAEVGMWLGITVSPAEGYEVASVSVNNQTTQVVVQGIYCFKVTNEAQSVKVLFKDQALNATVNIVAPTNGTVKVSYIDYNNGGAMAPQTEVQNGGTVDLNAGDMWLVFAVTPATGYELESITVNGTAASNFGAWLFHLNNKEVTEYNVVVTFKAEGAADSTSSVVTYTTPQNGTISIKSFDLAGQTPSNWAEVQQGSTVEAGKWLAITGTAAEGYTVGKVYVNNEEVTFVMAGMYCYQVKGGALNISVTFVDENTLPLNATINIATPTNGTVKVSYIDYNNGGAMAPQTEVQNGGTVDLNAGDMWLVFAVTPTEGYVLDTITVNGTAASNFGAWLFHLNNKEVTEYNVVVTFKAAE